MSDFQAWIEFRRNENAVSAKLICCECGKPAQGNVYGENGEICDDCHEQGQKDD